MAAMNVLVCRVVFMCRLLSAGFTRHSYCSSSPTSEKAASALPTDAPQTTLVAEAAPVLVPQTTLNAFVVLSVQGSDVPQTTEFPLTIAVPQTTELPHTTDVPQTTELLATLEFP